MLIFSTTVQFSCKQEIYIEQLTFQTTFDELKESSVQVHIDCHKKKKKITIEVIGAIFWRT